MNKLNHENIESIITQMSEINHKDAIGDMPNSKDEAYHSGFATALMVIRLALRNLEE